MPHTLEISETIFPPFLLLLSSENALFSISISRQSPFELYHFEYLAVPQTVLAFIEGDKCRLAMEVTTPMRQSPSFHTCLTILSTIFLVVLLRFPPSSTSPASIHQSIHHHRALLFHCHGHQQSFIKVLSIPNFILRHHEVPLRYCSSPSGTFQCKPHQSTQAYVVSRCLREAFCWQDNDSRQINRSVRLQQLLGFYCGRSSNDVSLSSRAQSEH